MKTIKLILPAALVGSAAFFFGATNLEAYTFDGNVLGLFDRDFRVFNNFTDPSANNNTTPSLNYPGSLGAVQAMWKGSAEWNSQPVGNGQGDPTQVTLGSGGANFDAFYAGQATSAGVIGNNIMSELAGSSGGVLAFTELPPSPGGWRILYYSIWEWHDGPSSISGGSSSFDLQGITAHEYGHALGMGHTPVLGSTMEPAAAALNTSLRSIESDDIAGVQALYGVKSVNKLTLTSFTGSGNPLRLTGTNFAPSNNEVWFTSLNPTASNASMPIKVVALLSSGGGTTIDVNVPATAGIGNMIVRNGGSAAYFAASNMLPYDPSVCPKAVAYCTGKPNSVGDVASISFGGSNSLVIGGLKVQCDGGVPLKIGIFIFSDNGAAANPFMGGTLCLLAPILRMPATTFDALGHMETPVTFGALEIGTYRYFQTWYRDPQSPDGIPVGLSNAAFVKFCP